MRAAGVYLSSYYEDLRWTYRVIGDAYLSKRYRQSTRVDDGVQSISRRSSTVRMLLIEVDRNDKMIVK